MIYVLLLRSEKDFEIYFDSYIWYMKVYLMLKLFQWSELIYVYDTYLYAWSEIILRSKFTLHAKNLDIKILI